MSDQPFPEDDADRPPSDSAERFSSGTTSGGPDPENPDPENLDAEQGGGGETPPVPAAESKLRTPVRRVFVRPSRSRKPGPGLFEAGVWTVGVLLVHQLAVAATMLGLAVGILLVNGEFRREDVVTLDSPMMPVVVGGEMLGFVLIAFLAGTLRLRWSRLPERLPVRRLPVRQLFLLVALVLPMTVVSDACYQLADRHLWQPLVQQQPQLKSLDAQDTMELIPKLAEHTTLPVLLLILAVAPAVGEELVFRGVIGRGLTARWGLAGGVLLTSCLFAVLHIHPAHAAGVLPLGICMHLLYLATRNFLAPVLFHLLNNSLATVATKSPDLFGMAAPNQLPPWSSIAAGGLCSVLLLLLVWSTRTQFRRDDGSLWSPGFPTADRPPAFLDLQPVHRPAPAWLWAATGLSLLAFLFSGAA